LSINACNANKLLIAQHYQSAAVYIVPTIKLTSYRDICGNLKNSAQKSSEAPCFYGISKINSFEFKSLSKKIFSMTFEVRAHLFRYGLPMLGEIIF